jgi:hypothetical protein
MVNRTKGRLLALLSYPTSAALCTRRNASNSFSVIYLLHNSRTPREWGGYISLVAFLKNDGAFEARHIVNFFTSLPLCFHLAVHCQLRQGAYLDKRIASGTGFSLCGFTRS